MLHLLILQGWQDWGYVFWCSVFWIAFAYLPLITYDRSQNRDLKSPPLRPALWPPPFSTSKMRTRQYISYIFLTWIISNNEFPTRANSVCRWAGFWSNFWVDMRETSPERALLYRKDYIKGIVVVHHGSTMRFFFFPLVGQASSSGAGCKKKNR